MRLVIQKYNFNAFGLQASSVGKPLFGVNPHQFWFPAHDGKFGGSGLQPRLAPEEDAGSAWRSGWRTLARASSVWVRMVWEGVSHSAMGASVSSRVRDVAAMQWAAGSCRRRPGCASTRPAAANAVTTGWLRIPDQSRHGLPHAVRRPCRVSGPASGYRANRRSLDARLGLSGERRLNQRCAALLFCRCCRLWRYSVLRCTPSNRAARLILPLHDAIAA